MSVLEWLWSFLPDRCQIEGCCRAGVRGNENVLEIMGSPVILCDYCSMRYRDGEILSIRRPWWDIDLSGR